MTTIYDVLITLIQYGMPIAGVIVGIFLSKRNENEKLKREIYLEANRALSKYKDIYITAPLNISENMPRLHEQQMLTEAAKADLEIIGSDEAVESYGNCLKFIRDTGREVLCKKQEEKDISIDIKEIPSYKKFFDSWDKWNYIIRKDLRIIK